MSTNTPHSEAANAYPAVTFHWPYERANAQPVVTFHEGAEESDSIAAEYAAWWNTGRRREAEAAAWLADRGYKAERIGVDSQYVTHERLVRL